MSSYIFVLVLLVRLIVYATANEKQNKQYTHAVKQKRKGRLTMLQLFRLKNAGKRKDLFNGYYVDVRTLYIHTFRRIPNIQFIGSLRVSDAFNFLYDEYRADILHVYQHTYYDPNDRNVYFNNTIFIMTDKRMIELGSNYCYLLFTTKQVAWSRSVTDRLSEFVAVATTPAHKTVTGFARQEILN